MHWLHCPFFIAALRRNAIHKKFSGCLNNTGSLKTGLRPNGLFAADGVFGVGRQSLAFGMGFAPHIGGQDVDFFVGQKAFPCRHLVVAAAGNRCDDVFFATAPQPSVVGQVRCHALVALAFVAVADRAVGGKSCLAAGGTLFVMLLA